MAEVTICSDFEAQENKVCQCFHCFPIYLPWRDRTGCHDIHFLNSSSVCSCHLFLISSTSADIDCNHEIKRHFLLGRKVTTNLDSILKSREITLPTKVHLVKAMAFPVVMKRWELDHKGDWTPKNWCFWTAVLEKTPESPLHSKNIKPINPKGNQPWICIGRTDAEGKAPLLWPPDVKSQLWKKTLLLGMIEGRKRRGQERMRWLDVITDSMDNEFEQTLGNSEGQESLVCCSPWGSQRVGHDSVTE